MPRPIDQRFVKGATYFYRPPYEGIAAIAWILGAIVLVAMARINHEASAFVGYPAIPMFIVGLVRLKQLWQNWSFKTRLTMPLPPWIEIEDVLEKQKNTGKVFLGKGFVWEPYHARLMKEISSLGKISALEPPKLFSKAMIWSGRSARDVLLEGKHYIHGCAGYEEDILLSSQSLRGHTLILGTTGAGKTRLLEALVMQSISRREAPDGPPPRNKLKSLLGTKSKVEEPIHGPVFILDPKGDTELRDRAYATAKRFGRENEFYYFSPTNAHLSFRINPLATYRRVTEIANRVSALLPSGGDSDTFKQFAWRAINIVMEGLEYAKIEVDLLTLRNYVEGGIETLVVDCLQKYLDSLSKDYPDWKTKVSDIQKHTKGNGKLNQQAALKAAALAAYYTQNVKKRHPNTTIDGMLEVLTHDSAHYSKLISNLIPILVQLTSGPMGTLLSDSSKYDDARQATNFESLIRRNCIVYINFESLADGVVGSALGSLFLADLTACAATRHHRGQTHPPVSIYVDEAAEMINDPFIQALNKGRSAGFELTLATQTIPDFEARMGNKAKAMQVLGNVNTTIVMRPQETESIQMVIDKFAETTYDEQSTSKTSTTIAAMENKGRDYSGSVMKGSQSTALSLINLDLLTSLPPGHFFAHLPGGKKVKGRVLMMPLKDSDRFIPEKHGRKPERYPLGLPDEKQADNFDARNVVSLSLEKNPDYSYASDASAINLPLVTTSEL